MRRNFWWCPVLAVGIVVIDQLSKASYSHYTLNTIGGFAFQISNLVAALLAILLLLALATVAKYTNAVKMNQTIIIGLALEIGGGFSNLLDRWYFGGVRDVYVLPLTSFNLADISIIGGALLIISSLIVTAKNPSIYG